MIFRPELAAKVRAGEKTATRRAFSDKPRSPWHEHSGSYPVGKVFAVQPGRGVASICRARVTRRAIEALCGVTCRDARAEGFPTRDAFVEAWEAIHGAWSPYQRVHVVEFEVVELL